MNKKVLIISYYWPPAGGISVLRSLKIAKYLTHFGWEPIIYTVENAQYPILEPNNEKHIPKGITILKQPCFEPFDLYKKLTGRNKKDTLANVLNANDEKKGLIHQFSVWLRANFFIPDARALWISPSVKFLTKYLKENPVDAIFSDGPPHTNTLIAAKLSKATNTPWLMDWQDPWTEVDYYKMFPIGKRANKKHHQLEQFCLNQASKSTIVSPSWKTDIENLGAKNVSVIVWGYDEDDYIDFKTLPIQSLIISHMGLMGTDRAPNGFIKAIKNIQNAPSQKVPSLKVKFYGTVAQEIQRNIDNENLTEYFEIKGQVPRAEALQTMFDSEIQLLILNKADNAKGRIPGKLFENLRVNKPILCLGPTDSDVASILRQSNAGDTFEHDDIEGIQNFLINVITKKVVYSTKNIDQYSIKTLTGKIASYLDDITRS